MGVSWLVQSTRAAKLHAEIANAIYTHHASIGVVNADVRIQPINVNPEAPIGPANPLRYSVEDNFDRLDVDMAFSLTSTTANAIDRRAAIHAIAVTSEALQGSVAAQIADLADTTSTATRFDWANRPPSAEDPSGGAGARRFYAFNASNDVHAATLAEFEGANATTGLDGVHRPGEPEIGDSERVVWRARLATTISTYADSGYDVIASEESFLGPRQRAAAYELDHIDAVGDPWFTHEPSSQRGGALVATRYVGGEPVEIAHVTVGYVLSMKGGGGGAQASHQATYDPSTAADILRSRFVDRSEAVGVDLQTGTPTYASPATLRVGNGGFPYELSASLIWRGGQQESERVGPISHVAPNTPWTTNWNNTLTISGSGLEAMGQSDVRAVASTIAAFLAMQDIYRQAVSNQREVASILAAAWWARGLSGNVVTVNVGADTRQFLRNTTGWFSPGASAYATLTQTGSRSIIANQPCGPWSVNDPNYAYTRGWNYNGVSFTVTNANGDAQSFPYWANDYSVPGEITCAHLHGWRMSQWTFPRGVTINLVYQNDGLLTLDRLAEVNNSLGRRIVFSNSGLSGFNNGFASGSPDYRAVTVTRTGDITTHADAAGAQTRIDHEIVNERHILNDVFDANDTTIPSLRYVYDTLYRVKEAFDAEALQDASVPREAYEFRIAPNARSERADPATPTNGRYTVLYDEDRRPFRFIDELGRTTSAQYDGRGRATRYIYPELDEERLTYDARNRVTQMRRCAKSGCNVATDIVINATWNDAWNKPATITDARGYRTDFAYVASGQGVGELLSATRPAPSGATPIGSGTRPVYSFGYGAFGRVATSTDPTGLVTSNVINATTGNISATTLNPGGVNATTSFTYDAQGDVTTTTDPRGNAASSSYDAMRRPTLVRNHNGGSGAALIAAQRTNYDSLGRVTSTEGGTAFSGTTVTSWQTQESRTYTPTSQVATVTNGAGNVTTNAYDGLDRLLSVSDPVGRVTRNTYDSAGQLTLVQRAFGSPLQQNYATYSYSPNGQRLSVIDANNNRSEYAYDGHDRLSRLTFPQAALGANAVNPSDYEQYDYDANGNRTSLRMRSGESIAYTYDNLNRETLKDIPGGTGADVYSSYDLAGRRLSSRFVSTTGQGVIYAYDSAGRLTSEQSTIGTARTLSYQYDLASNRTRVTWPDGFFASYTYDALNRVDQIGENGVFSGATLLADYTYDALGRRSGLTRGNGAVSAYAYDTASRLTGLTQNLTGTVDDQNFDFSYTAASQMSGRTTSNDNYAWPTPAVNRSYNRNGLNQYTAISGTAHTHDARGNLRNDGARALCYDLENRLIAVDGAADVNCPTPTASVAYDPLGRLRQTIAGAATTQFLYDGDRLVAEYNGATLTRRYVHGPGVDEPLVWYECAAAPAPCGTADRRYLITDHQGSVIAANGNTTTRYSYGPYGEPNTWVGPRFRYTGQIVLDPDLNTATPIALYHYKRNGR
jgi:YD repeat-containing protein